MSYIIIRIYSFKCDSPGCQSVEDITAMTIDEARNQLRGEGWSWSLLARHDFCPEHSKGEETQ